MENNMWFLMADSILEYYKGAGNIMNNSIQTAMKSYCELSGNEYKYIKENVEEIVKQSLNDINRDWNKQGLFLELVELRLTKFKVFLDSLEVC